MLIDVNVDLLSFTEYTLEGFTQERPFEPVVGQMYYFWNEDMIECKAVLYSQYLCKNYLGYINSWSYGYKFISETNPLL
jgi:hypothetical protein